MTNDQEFIKKINNNEISFSKGDMLEVEMQKHSWWNNNRDMKIEYAILQVISHRSAAKQLNLLI